MANRLFPAGPWRYALLAGALMFSVPLAASAQAPAGDPVVAKVDGVDIHQSDIALAEEELGASLPLIVAIQVLIVSHYSFIMASMVE